MKNCFASALLILAVCSGCASNKSVQSKPVYQRPWLGGHVETVPAPSFLRTNSPPYEKRGLLITHLHPDTPLQKAGCDEGDLVLAINGTNIWSPQQLEKAIEKNGADPFTFTIYRHGELLDKTVTPGIERFQKENMITFGLGLSSRIQFDFWPNPDFSLVALGYGHNREQLDLTDPKSKYLQELAIQEGKTAAPGLHSDEGWKFWLGPFWFEQRRFVLSQE